jgi:hypothetical protein
VQFTVTLPFKWIAHCHCTMCRRAHGAAFVTWCGCVEDRVVVIGADHLVSYRSSGEATRQRCKVCGAQVFFRGDRWPGEVHVARALFPDDVGGQEPQVHVFFADKAPWVHVDDALPKRSALSSSSSS